VTGVSQDVSSPRHVGLPNFLQPASWDLMLRAFCAEFLRSGRAVRASLLRRPTTSARRGSAEKSTDTHSPVIASKNSIGSDSQPVGMHKQSSELVEYHRIIAEIDYHGMEAVLKPRMKVSKSRSTGR